MTSVLLKRDNMQNMGAETIVKLPEAKECLRLPETGGGKKRFIYRDFREAIFLLSLDFGLLACRTWKE